MSIVAKKIMMGSGAVALPSDDQFNRVSFLSHFEGANNGVNNVFDDGSTSNHTITANGNVTQGSFGPFARPDGEWGVSFDGASDYLDANDGPTFGTGAFTIEFFANLRTVGSVQSLFDSRPDLTNGFYPAVYVYANNTLVYYFNSGERITSSETLSANTWYHIAVCRSGTSTKLFLNGTQVGSTYSDSNNYPDSGRMRVGTSAYRISDGFHVDGVISNLRVVNSALYTSNFTAPTGKLTAVTNTKLLTCQSNRFVDNSADGLTMTPSGDAAVSAFGPFLTSAVYDAAVNGASVYLDGDGDYLTLSPQSDFAFGTGDFSVSLWVYFSAQGSFDYLIDGRNSGQTSGTWTLSINYTSGAAGKLMFASGSNAILTSDTNLNRFQWYYITVSRSGTTSRMHFNGTQVAINSSDSTNYSTSPNTSYIGTRYSNEHYFKGYMCDVRVVKGTALSSYTPPTAPLTAITNTKLLLNMADGQAIDSAAQNNLTLYGTAKTSTAQKKFGTASLLLDGNSDYVNLNTGFNMAGGDFTFEMFVRLNAINVGQTLFDTRPDSTNGLYHQLYIHSQNRILYVVSGATKIDAAANTLNLTTDTWYHIALCRSGTSTKLFLDGTQKGSTYSDSTVYINSGKCLIGVSSYGNTGNWGNYYMDDFRASNFARYTSNFTAPTEPFADKGQ